MGLVALVAAGIAVSPALGAPDRLAPSRPLTIGMEDGIGSFTPASADPKLAAALARSGLNASGFRFTPSEASKDEQHRVTVAVRKRVRSEEHTSELQSLMRISYAVFCLKKKKHINKHRTTTSCLHT